MLTAGKYWGMRRLADAQGRYKMLAVDQRPPLKNRMTELGFEADMEAHVAAVKEAMIRELSPYCTAALLDPHYAYPGGISLYDPAKGLIMTMEDSNFQATPDGRVSKEIDDWSVEKVKRCGGDAVKVLTWYRPDASPANIQAQKDFSKRVGDACAKYDLPYVFELLTYALPGEENQTSDYVEDVNKRSDQVIQSVEDFAGEEYGVDLFKVESPVLAADLASMDAKNMDIGKVQSAFEGLATACGRPWVMLSAGAKPETFEQVLHYAYAAGASGFLAGRAIWWQAFQAYPDPEAFVAALREKSVPYFQQLNALTDEKATPWMQHPKYQAASPVEALKAQGSEFRYGYHGFGD